MKKKKLLVILLAITMIFTIGMLAACGGDISAADLRAMVNEQNGMTASAIVGSTTIGETFTVTRDGNPLATVAVTRWGSNSDANTAEVIATARQGRFTFIALTPDSVTLMNEIIALL